MGTEITRLSSPCQVMNPPKTRNGSDFHVYMEIDQIYINLRKSIKICINRYRNLWNSMEIDEPTTNDPFNPHAQPPRRWPLGRQAGVLRGSEVAPPPTSEECTVAWAALLREKPYQ